MSVVIDITDDIERAEQQFADSGKTLAAACADRDWAERRIEQIKSAIKSTNAEMARSSEDLTKEVCSFEEQLLETSKIDSSILQRITKLRAAYSVLSDLVAELGFLKLPEAQVALREAEVSITDVLASRFAFRAKLQQLRRDALLGDVIEAEGEIKIDEDSGKTGEFRRLAAEHRLSAERARQEVLTLKAGLDERRKQVLQLRLTGRK
jgi:hypothetical protein